MPQQDGGAATVLEHQTEDGEAALSVRQDTACVGSGGDYDVLLDELADEATLVGVELAPQPGPQRGEDADADHLACRHLGPDVVLQLGVLVCISVSVRAGSRAHRR